MKLPYQQLETHLAKTLAPIYWVSGDELLLVQDCVELIRARALSAGFSERIRITPDRDTDWGEALYANAHSLSLFATKQLIELDLRGAKVNQTTCAPLKEFAEHPNNDTVLLIYANKLDSKSEQHAWYKALDKTGVMITLWPIPAEQLPQWMMQRAKKINLQLTLPAATRIAELVEGNLLAAAQELEKLRLLGTNVDEQTLDQAITDSSRFDIFNWVDSVLIGNAQRSLRILANLRAEDIEPTLILWAITRELRTMAELHQQTQQGIALASLFGKHRIWEKRQAGVRAFLKRHHYRSCCDMLVIAAQVDRMIKGVETGNLWDRLEQLTLIATQNASFKV